MLKIKIQTIVGLFISIVSICVAIWTSYAADEGFLALELHEQGDFLAGFIAPLALVWLVIGYLQQGEELKSNTEALLSQKEEFEVQNISIKKQLFENTYFNLLELHSDITESVKIDIKGETLQGRKAIIQILLVFIVDLHRYNNSSELSDELFSDEEGGNKIKNPHKIYEIENKGSPQIVSDTYKRFYEKYQSHIGHYFRNLYLIIKYIDRSDLASKEKKFYTNLLRAQLSSDELLFLFYNCSSPHGIKKLKPHVEKYELLEHLPVYKCLNGLANNFESRAFGKSISWGNELY